MIVGQQDAVVSTIYDWKRNRIIGRLQRAWSIEPQRGIALSPLLKRHRAGGLGIGIATAWKGRKTLPPSATFATTASFSALVILA
jgi:hypothetical protein